MIHPVDVEPLRDALDRVASAPLGLLAVGRPQCPACELLEVTLGVVQSVRPDLVIASTQLDTPEDWALREELLWPRGIRVSRASMPTLVLMRGGMAIAHRHASGPASDVDAWITEHLGPGTTPLTGVSEGEIAALELVAPLRERYLAGRAGRDHMDGGTIRR